MVNMLEIRYIFYSREQNKEKKMSTKIQITRITFLSTHIDVELLIRDLLKAFKPTTSTLKRRY